MKRKIMYVVFLLSGILLVNDNVLAAGFSTGKRIQMCGINSVPENIPMLTSGLYNLVKILVPIILVIMGMIDFMSAMSASDEDKMKKSQKKFITRLIAAVIIFFVMAIVQFVFNKIDFDSTTKNDFNGCMDCLLSNNCEESNVPQNKSCLYYSLEKCPSIDSMNNQCYKDTENNRCTFKCSGLTKEKCDTLSIEGYCNWNGSSCSNSSDYTKKKCTDYDFKSCPTKDDYGNTCSAIDSNKTEAREKKKGECIIATTSNTANTQNTSNTSSTSTTNNTSSTSSTSSTSNSTNTSSTSNTTTPSNPSPATSSNTSSDSIAATTSLNAYCSGVCAIETLSTAKSACLSSCRISCDSNKDNCSKIPDSSAKNSCYQACFKKQNNKAATITTASTSTTSNSSQASPSTTNTESKLQSVIRCEDLNTSNCQNNSKCKIEVVNGKVSCVNK